MKHKICFHNLYTILKIFYYATFFHKHDPNLTSTSGRNRKLNISKKSYLMNYWRYFYNLYIILKIYNEITFHTYTWP